MQTSYLTHLNVINQRTLMAVAEEQYFTFTFSGDSEPSTTSISYQLNYLITEILGHNNLASLNCGQSINNPALCYCNKAVALYNERKNLTQCLHTSL